MQVSASQISSNWRLLALQNQRGTSESVVNLTPVSMEPAATATKVNNSSKDDSLKTLLFLRYLFNPLR